MDTKAVQEAYKAVQEAHPNLPSLYVTADLTGGSFYMPVGGLQIFCRVKCRSLCLPLCAFPIHQEILNRSLHEANEMPLKDWWQMRNLLAPRLLINQSKLFVSGWLACD